MKKITQNRGRFATTLVVLATAVILAACGGSPDPVPPTPPAVDVTVTCPNGTSSTAATTALANAACPAPTLVSVSPANGDTTVSPDSLTGILVTSDSDLDATSLTTTNITLKIGSLTTITSTVSVIDAKSFKLIPSAKLSYGQAYDFTATVKDTFGKTLTVTSTFTTSVVVCTAPAMLNSEDTCVSPPAPTGYTWNSIMKVWVADIGVLVTGANALPASCVTVGDACWLANVANGTIKFVDSGVVMTGLNTRPVVFAFYVTSGGFYSRMPIYADVSAASAYVNQGVINGGAAITITDIKGSSLGAKMTVPSQGCFEMVWSGSGFVINSASCPI